jgi:hypothetical protein
VGRLAACWEIGRLGLSLVRGIWQRQRADTTRPFCREQLGATSLPWKTVWVKRGTMTFGWWSDIAPDLQLHWNCASIRLPWSIISSSPPNSQLAGVLAGFMITAAAFLFEWKDPRPYAKPSTSTQVPTYTLALFISGVLVLGLDSYLFGTISAIAPAALEGDTVKPEAPVCLCDCMDPRHASEQHARGRRLGDGGRLGMDAHPLGR